MDIELQGTGEKCNFSFVSGIDPNSINKEKLSFLLQLR